MNSLTWWNEVKNDSSKLSNWLIKQYRGEVTAASRIRTLAKSKAKTKEQEDLLEVIATQEEIHADWILQLLKSRNITPSIEHAEEKYWAKTLPLASVSFENAVAVGAQAEAMRLERIKVISNDDTTSLDIQDTFKRILVDELFHERTFRGMATKESLDSHNLGLELLGLTE